MDCPTSVAECYRCIHHITSPFSQKRSILADALGAILCLTGAAHAGAEATAHARSKLNCPSSSLRSILPAAWALDRRHKRNCCLYNLHCIVTNPWMPTLPSAVAIKCGHQVAQNSSIKYIRSTVEAQNHCRLLPFCNQTLRKAIHRVTPTPPPIKTGHVPLGGIKTVAGSTNISSFCPG